MSGDSNGNEGGSGEENVWSDIDSDLFEELVAGIEAFKCVERIESTNPFFGTFDDYFQYQV
jgi:hypothetical protein